MRVLYFHTLRQICGTEAEHIPDEPETVGGLLALLIARHPDLAKFENSILVARNHEFVDRAEPIEPSDEIALMPPLSGG